MSAWKGNGIHNVRGNLTEKATHRSSVANQLSFFSEIHRTIYFAQTWAPRLTSLFSPGTKDEKDEYGFERRVPSGDGRLGGKQWQGTSYIEKPRNKTNGKGCDRNSPARVQWLKA